MVTELIKSPIKGFRSPGYNFNFNMKTGEFARWGTTFEDDPEYSKVGPEIADIELSTICHNGCTFCSKSNTLVGKNMSLETFHKVFEALPVTLTQIAFGLGDIDGHPDLWKIMEICRINNVIPNITINGSRMTKEYYDKLAKLCGAVAVSYYDEDICFNAVQKLTDRGMTQVNIHALLSAETYNKCIHLLNSNDPRIEKLNAIVFLCLKQKGRGESLHQVKFDDYKKLVDIALQSGKGFGFDSCSAPMFLKAVKESPDYNKYYQMSEPCESACFSAYVNVEGKFFPCSFAEGTPGWEDGIDLLKCKNYTDFWNHPKTVAFRNKLISNKDCNNCRQCQIYKIGE